MDAREPVCTRHRRRPAGFSLVELLMVVVILTVLGVLAYPSLRTFAASDGDLESASFTARTLNRVKAQAGLHNRAYVLIFSNFSTNQPQGRLEVREGNSPSCIDVLANLAGSTRVLKRFGYGGEGLPANDPANDMTAAVEDVGLRGWLPPDADGNPANAQTEPLTLCVKPDGAVIDGGSLDPVGGRLRVLVQRFEQVDGAWRMLSPPRRVAITFAGPARLDLE